MKRAFIGSVLIFPHLNYHIPLSTPPSFIHKQNQLLFSTKFPPPSPPTLFFYPTKIDIFLSLT